LKRPVHMGPMKTAKAGMPGRMALVLAWAIRKRVLRGKLRHIAQRALSGTGHDIEIDGIRLRCYLADNATERDIFVGGADARRIGLRRVMEGLKPREVFVDIGANSGIFTAFAAKCVGPEGHVIAIEPIPEMIERLRFNIAVNGFTNVSIFQTAVGSEAGTALLHVHPRNRGQSSMAPDAVGTPIKVSVTPLADIVVSAGVGRIDTLKIDIEGFEDRALAPFLSTMPPSLWPRRIFMETVHSKRWAIDCVEVLRDAGYACLWQDKHNIALALRA
jgi:FkbM family methyltransferase